MLREKDEGRYEGRKNGRECKEESNGNGDEMMSDMDGKGGSTAAVEKRA